MIRSLSATDPVTASWLLALLAVLTVVVLVPVARIFLAGLLYGLGLLSGRRRLLAASARVMPRLGHLLGGLVIGAVSVASPAAADQPPADVGLVALDRDGSAPGAQHDTPSMKTVEPTALRSSTATPAINLDRGAQARDRATAARHTSRAQHPSTPAPTTTGTLYVVRTGDTLWDIAAEHLHEPTDAAITEGWRAIWRANRTVIGEHPELIHPGQLLRLDGFEA